MATVALWHLALTAVLTGVLLAVILVQSASDLVRRRRGARRPVPLPQQRSTTVEATPELLDQPDLPPAPVEPRMVGSDEDHDAVPVPDPALATAAVAR